MSRSEDPTTRTGRGRVYQEPEAPTSRRDPPTQGRAAARPSQPPPQAAPVRDDPRYRSQAPDLDWPPQPAAPPQAGHPSHDPRLGAARERAAAPANRASGLQPQFDPYVAPAPAARPEAAYRAEPRVAPPPQAAAAPRRAVAPPPQAWDDGLTAAPRQATAPRRAEPVARQPMPDPRVATAPVRPQTAAAARAPAPRQAAQAAAPEAYAAASRARPQAGIDGRRAPVQQPQYQDEDLYQPAGAYAEEADYGYEDGVEGDRGQGHAAQADDGYAEGEYGEDGFEEAGYDEPRPRGRRGLIVIGALVAAVAIGGGLGFVYKLTSESGGDGKPKVVQADKRPVKSAPEDEGGKTFAGTGKQIYERLGGTTAADEGQTEVVSQQEELIDRGDGETAGTTEEAAMPGIMLSEEATETAPRKKKVVEESGDGEIVSVPRKVQPVLIKPGETITDESAPMPGLAVVPASAEPVVAQTKKQKAKAKAEAAAIAEDLNGALATGSTEDVVAAETVTAKPKKKTAVEKTEQLALAQPATTASTTAAATQAETGTGGYVVQVRASTSRMDALGSFADMQQKYGSVLASGQPDIQEFKKGEQLWYRLRIGPPASKQAAGSLCTQLKASGLKECIVTRY